MTASEQTSTGRALIEAGRPVAGSMCRAAATVVFEPAAAKVSVSDRFAACLRTVADDAADVPVPRERVRAGAALAFAVEYAATLHRNGRRARDDGWFDELRGGRPAAQELAESVVAAARRSTDERRVRHLGYLLAEVTVSPDVDLELAARALRLVDSLGWRQLAVLAGVGRRERVPLPMAPLEDEPRAWSAWGAREDVAGLQAAGLLDPAPAAARQERPVPACGPRPAAHPPRRARAPAARARPAARRRGDRGPGRPGAPPLLRGSGPDRYRIVSRAWHPSGPSAASYRARGRRGEPGMREEHATGAETASVIAARQLAEDARRRRLPAELKRRRRLPLVVPPPPAPDAPSD